jgi:2-amino-4-hydroxy-6-hydroxymethyldihydropteridine diphosphokinase
MPQIYLSLGSNMGQRHENIIKAKKYLKKESIRINLESSLYEAEPWGLKDQPWFLNQCIKAESNLNPEQLLETIKKIETLLKRKHTQKYGPRTIDIDILYYGDVIIKNGNLQIPHPQINNRNFVLIPLNEIAPDFIDPIEKITIKELTQKCSDTCKLQKL